MHFTFCYYTKAAVATYMFTDTQTAFFTREASGKLGEVWIARNTFSSCVRDKSSE
ncbi:hypothetical protein HBI56_215720 [Parastagonospora nodorum]|uniref:Uncharacterized protein n=1 Tax=Phaeosphaeria nodorum (strain SN15 / ATCC MYA-4574 / FGSC 10173) TaxID=321614 RepID=A0A7U2HZA1_PHANO|nr:hypothetical protein HBH56_176740 [Parastagonospora nodorum]QRC96163.1 hypothetical protein JI435_408350 [Parastagonospora nodorum SN15]KAH3926328.1 hypothetical protein HBH54_166420 [Parastagonospora nodorum]KAH3939147.1 hypothetical protein HBH53_240500 [Parastagonospora nodorum]KAH3965573.1 hypothetical protein HBH52_203060 [Parastagonospora nodorum]